MIIQSHFVNELFQHCGVPLTDQFIDLSDVLPEPQEVSVLLIRDIHDRIAHLLEFLIQLGDFSARPPFFIGFSQPLEFCSKALKVSLRIMHTLTVPRIPIQDGV